MENTISGLLRKRSKLAGEIEATQDKLRQLLIDLDSIDHTIRVFDPYIDLRDVRPKPMPPRQGAAAGEMTRIIHAALRQHERMTAPEIALHAMAARGMNTSDQGMRKTVTKRVMSILWHHRGRGVLKSGGAAGVECGLGASRSPPLACSEQIVKSCRDTLTITDRSQPMPKIGFDPKTLGRIVTAPSREMTDAIGETAFVPVVSVDADIETVIQIARLSDIQGLVSGRFE